MDSGVQHIVTPQGDVLVVMPLAQYQRMSAAAGTFVFEGGPDGGGSDRPAAATAIPVPGPSILPAPIPCEVQTAIDEGESPLAAWRRHRDISQSRLARLAGVSRFTIMRMEANGAGAGNRHSRKLLASALGIPVSAL
jgi:DNA-binding XRE family transcriptional regulator